MRRLFLALLFALALTPRAYAQAVIVPSPVPALSDGCTLKWVAGSSTWTCSAPGAASQPLDDTLALVGHSGRNLRFDTSGITAATTRVWTIPDVNITVPTTLASLGANTFTGAQQMNSTLSVTSDFAVNTSKFTVAGGTGNTAIAGDFAIASTKFTVAAASGNTVVGGTLSVTGNHVSDILFTDATYDIGKSGATRPRDIFASRNGVFGGTLGVTGNVTLSGTGNSVGTITSGVWNAGAVTSTGALTSSLSTAASAIVVNTNKFTVEGSTGNTVVAGTLTAAGDIGLAATKKLYLDGVAMTGDTYIVESAGNTLSLYSGGVEAKLVSGVFTASGFGTHQFSASGTGDQIFLVRNTSNNSGSSTRVYVGNDSSSSNGVLYSFPSTYSTSGPYVANGFMIEAGQAGGLSIAATHASGAIRFYSGGTTEIGRFHSDGEFLIGATAQQGIAPARLGIKSNQASTWGIAVQPTADTASGRYVVLLNAAGTEQGSITATNSTTTAFNTSSDRRLKTDFGLASDLSALRAVVIHDFIWTDSGIPARGVFAQDAYKVFPAAITMGDDSLTPSGALAKPWQADYSKFVPDLIVGWQQHDAELTALRARVATLEAKLKEKEK